MSRWIFSIAVMLLIYTPLYLLHPGFWTWVSFNVGVGFGVIGSAIIARTQPGLNTSEEGN